MSDNLDNLTDARLSEIVAVEVAGIAPEALPVMSAGGCVPDYPNDANAVLPLLEKWRIDADFHSSYKTWIIVVKPTIYHPHDALSATAEAKTFARAACLALVRAKRSQS